MRARALMLHPARGRRTWQVKEQKDEADRFEAKRLELIEERMQLALWSLKGVEDSIVKAESDAARGRRDVDDAIGALGVRAGGRGGGGGGGGASGVGACMPVYGVTRALAAQVAEGELANATAEHAKATRGVRRRTCYFVCVLVRVCARAPCALCPCLPAAAARLRCAQPLLLRAPRSARAGVQEGG